MLMCVDTRTPPWHAYAEHVHDIMPIELQHRHSHGGLSCARAGLASNQRLGSHKTTSADLLCAVDVVARHVENALRDDVALLVAFCAFMKQYFALLEPAAWPHTDEDHKASPQTPGQVNNHRLN